MTQGQSLDVVRWALATHLPGMREPCAYCGGKGHLGGGVCGFCGKARTRYDGANAGRGWLPVPLTADWRIDVGRLLEAIEGPGRRVVRPMYCGDHYGCWQIWALNDRGSETMIGHDPDLATAFLAAVGKEAHP